MKATIQSVVAYADGNSTVKLIKEDGTPSEFTAPTKDLSRFVPGKQVEEVTGLPWRPTRAPRKPRAVAAPAEVAASTATASTEKLATKKSK